MRPRARSLPPATRQSLARASERSGHRPSASEAGSGRPQEIASRSRAPTGTAGSPSTRTGSSARERTVAASSESTSLQAPTVTQPDAVRRSETRCAADPTERPRSRASARIYVPLLTV